MAINRLKCCRFSNILFFESANNKIACRRRVNKRLVNARAKRVANVLIKFSSFIFHWTNCYETTTRCALSRQSLFTALSRAGKKKGKMTGDVGKAQRFVPESNDGSDIKVYCLHRLQNYSMSCEGALCSSFPGRGRWSSHRLPGLFCFFLIFFQADLWCWFIMQAD